MFRKILAMCAFLAVIAPAWAQPAAPLRVERVVMVMRHGLRAPINGEVPQGTQAASRWPRWPVPAEHLTPRGAAALQRLGAENRRWLAGLELMPAKGCPKRGAVRIWTNTAQRTMASGEAFGRGLLPGCAMRIGHRRQDEVDPLFEPLRARAADFSADAAIASINAHTGGPAALAARHAAALAELDSLLGCGERGGCSPMMPEQVRASRDGHGVDLSGAIRTTSGTAQVLLLQYVEGLSPEGRNWRALTPEALERIGALHAALFDVFTRPPYMAARQAGPLGRRVLETLGDDQGPLLDVLVGHDTNVTAVAAALGLSLKAPGYALDDVAPGGTLIIQALRDAQNKRWVKIDYQTQSPSDLRQQAATVSRVPVAMDWCGGKGSSLCPWDRFASHLSAQLAPPRLSRRADQRTRA